MDTRPLYRREGFKSNPDFIRFTFHKLINEEGFTDFTKIVDELKRRCQMVRVNYYFNEIHNELEFKKNKDDTISAPGILEIDDASLASELNELNINNKTTKSKKETKKETKEKEAKASLGEAFASEGKPSEIKQQQIKVKKVKEDKQSVSSEEDYEDTQSSEEQEEEEYINDEQEAKEEIIKQQNKQLLKRLNKLTLDLEIGINDTYDIIKKVLKDNCADLDEANNIFSKFEDIIEGIIFLLIEDKIDEVYKELKKK